jgi:hypothetical protein
MSGKANAIGVDVEAQVVKYGDDCLWPSSCRESCNASYGVVGWERNIEDVAVFIKLDRCPGKAAAVIIFAFFRL